MSRKRFHGLKRIKVRATWNKYNLYNLSRLPRQPVQSQTFFQQKWKAKSALRAYHGEFVREKQWQRMFSPRLNAAVPMDHRYLAQHDGSELAEGRGSGKELAPDVSPPSVKPIPYMHMTFAPMERRLDIAVFRALFASSARQARQMVVHRQVTVNGLTMPYPGYLLNPGDMFQVEPERVMFATGAFKERDVSRKWRNILRDKRRKLRQQEERRAKNAQAKKAKAPALTPTIDLSIPEPHIQIPTTELEERKWRRTQFAQLISTAQDLINQKQSRMSAKRKQTARSFVKDVKAAMKSKSTWNTDLESVRAIYDTFKKRLSSDVRGISDEVFEAQRTKALTRTRSKVEKVGEEARISFEESRDNPVDLSKPYATPWRPRPYMSAFAFIPRYLEVNQKICSAVYLRHPVARPGLSEIPSPFPPEQQQLAFLWYLRRR